MGKIIILEGPDGGGKSTLAKELVERGFIYRHEGPPQYGVDLVAHYLKILNESIESGVHCVHDRLWLGERIYGPICRAGDNLGEEGQTLFQRLHASKNIRHIVCLLKFDAHLNNYRTKMTDKHDYLKSEERFRQVYSSYSKWVSQHGSIARTFDYRIHKVEDILGESLHRTLPTGTIGSPGASTLFIGDTPNHPTIDVPFFALKGSSGYFNKALLLAGFEERDIAISNASGPMGEHDLESILKSLPYLEKIILMGNQAEKWFLGGYGLIKSPMHYKIFRVHHPSFLKRFKGSNPQIMADLIKGVL